MTKLLSLLLQSTALRSPENEGGAGGEGDAAAAAAATAAAAAAAAAAAPAEKAKPPEGLDAKYWDADAGALKAEDLVRDFTETAKWRTDNEARLAAIEEREKAVPKDPKDYQVAFPEDAPVVEGFAFEIDPADPLLGELRTFAQKNGLSQEAFSGLLNLRREMERQEFVALRDASAKFREELGPQADQRADAIETFLKATVGDEAAVQLSAVLFNKTQFEAMEKLVSLAGRVNPNGYQSGGNGGGESTLSDEEWEAMTPDQRIEYGKKHTPKPVKPKKAAA